jgi:hypothetical protein
LYLLEDVVLYPDMAGVEDMTGVKDKIGVEDMKEVEDMTGVEGMKNDVRKKDKYGEQGRRGIIGSAVEGET